ncbi:MaoC/PaaZ C-terminal domain-containing protein [Nonomuraea sp. NPDC049486]|uniref:MaoC/PaaZ C-terminal domain-containing protein n=1 Tax=unclassified Nonomuraea TaxID=2593643 RepID=UPI0011CD5F29|nr:MaoC/PaaZ C-terminal domain-containing protein [Nonomuraea sp. C10]TXK40137.1 acyl dehydratase [Nonomuraea sp. C10]
MTAVAAGDTRELVLVRDLTRTRIVQYAGASGDFNPVHTDERFAVEAAGYPSVFAHGMLTMGMAGRVLTDWFGPESLLRYEARFRAQVFPGATLTARARVESVHGDGTAAVALTVTDGQDAVVMTGNAVVRASAEAK